MARRVIRPLRCMDETGMVLGHKILKEAMEVGSRRGIGILVDHETRTGMLDKDRGKARADTTGVQQGFYLISNLIGPLPPGRDMEALGNGLHEFMNEGP